MTQLSLFSNLENELKPHVRELMEEKAIKKLYYSIAEVSKITGLKPYVLRYWETEFSELKPAKNRAGNRIYKKSDIRIIFLIKRLLYQQKYTIEGAKQRLLKLKKHKDPKQQLALSNLKREDLITEIHTELKAILDILNNNVGA